MVLVVDAQVAGISGDMVVCGLVDMGASASRVSDGVRDAVAASLPGAQLDGVAFEAVVKGGIAATRMSLGGAGGAQGGGGHGVGQLRECIARGCDAAGLSAAAARIASDSFEILVSAEASVHGGAADAAAAGSAGAHLHEAACLDTVADMLGAAIAIDDIGLAGERVACTPVAVGGGTVTFSHGTTPCPAPAVVEALRGSGIAVCPGGGQGAAGAPDGELATPTGVSILRAMRPECARAYPEMAVEAVGHGAGSRDYGRFANVLRLVRGTEESDPRVRSGTVGVLEAIIDDATGEEMGRAIGSLASAAGALDAWAAPAVGRKGRPAHALTVVCEAGAERRLARAVMAETGTLGVRVRRSDRVEAARSVRQVRVSIAGSGSAVRVKASALTGREKPESDDVAAAAAAAGVPYREAARGIAGALRGRPPGGGAGGAGDGSAES